MLITLGNDNMIFLQKMHGDVQELSPQITVQLSWCLTINAQNEFDNNSCLGLGGYCEFRLQSRRPGITGRFKTRCNRNLENIPRSDNDW